jgi:hypothetical protein
MGYAPFGGKSQHHVVTVPLVLQQLAMPVGVRRRAPVCGMVQADRSILHDVRAPYDLPLVDYIYVILILELLIDISVNPM